jgi:hypothetical protein
MDSIHPQIVLEFLAELLLCEEFGPVLVKLLLLFQFLIGLL